jgi:beta-lactam-binding protein with PASTA domain/predicted Ser/Thr protein kinase
MTQPRVVGSRYELGELIGYGGMAEVHRGRDTRLNREVAIKVLRADLARDPSFLNRFRREAHSAAGLNHPSIVSVYDTGEDAAPDGTPQPFIVMEFVQGRTLRDIIKSEGRLPARRAMEIVADVCAALDFSHRNGIIHRDIKPANVMITPQGAVKVMDFGIARAVADNSATVTQTANVIGTAQYLSPEQARGETVDARSDVYSTGCLLYELVTGVPPFQGDSPVAVAYQHVRENPVVPSARNPEIPRVIDSIVMKALAKNQLNRYQSAGDMRQDLQRALADQPVNAEAVMTDAERTQFIARTPPPPIALRRDDFPPPGEEDQRRTGLIWAAVVVALLLVIGAAAYAIVFLGKDNGTKTYAVPDVIGQSEAAARVSLANHFKPVKGTDTSGPCFGGATVAKGYVCTVDPAPNTDLKENGKVTYHLYTQKLVQVPFVEGKTYAEALQTLNGAGLRVKKHNVNNRETANTVLHQSLEAYVSRVPPGTVITLDVSTGVLKLPDVTGKTFDNAQNQLNRAGFTNVAQDSSTVETHSQSKDGKVADMSPSPGNTYDPGQKITLSLYHYVPVTPTCTTSASTPSTGSSSSSSGSSSSSASASTPPSGGASGGLPPC